MGVLDELKKKANELAGKAKEAAGQELKNREAAGQNVSTPSTRESVRETVKSAFEPVSNAVEKVKNRASYYDYSNQEQQKWYKGDKPTHAETLGRIYQLGEKDPSQRDELWSLYQQEASNPSSILYERYGQATSQYLDALGLTADDVNDEFFSQMAPYFASGIITNAGNQSTGKKNSVPGNLAALYDDYQKTKLLLAEQDQAMKEAQYWIAKGLSDDEIKAKLNIGGDGSKYTNLKKALEKTATGEYEPTTAPVQLLTSYGVDGMLYALRNPDNSTGDFLLDAVQKEMGRGNSPTVTEADKLRRTPGSETWSPYENGTTMDDEGIRFGVTQFDKGWLDANRAAILGSGDKDAIAAYGRVYDAEERTLTAESELEDLNADIVLQLQANPTQDADALIASLFYDADGAPKYATLAAMDESLLSGQVLAMTRGIGYNRKEIEENIRAVIADAQLREQATVDPAAMETVVQGEKKAASEENGGSLFTPGSFTDEVPAMIQKSVLFDGNISPEAMREGLAWIGNQLTEYSKSRRELRKERIEQEKQQEEAETQQKLNLSEQFISEADEASELPEPVAVIASAGANDVAGVETEPEAAAQTPVMTAEEYAAAQEQVYALEAEGRYEEAAKMQFPLLVAAVTNSDDEYVKELVTSVGSQEASVYLTRLIFEGDMLNNLDDLEVWDAVTNYEYYVCKVLDIDTASADLFTQAMDFVTGGAASQTKDNEGLGVLQMTKSAVVKGASGVNDVWANLVGAAMTGYGYAVKGTNWIVDNTLGKLFGFKMSEAAADTAIQAGQDLSQYYDKIGANEDAYLRENATTLEYMVATAGGEAIKMGIESAAGSAVVGKVAGGVGKILNKGGLRNLTTAMDLAKVEGYASKIASASPFIAESFGAEFQQTYSETENPGTAVLSALVAAFGSSAFMNMDAIKNIENMGAQKIPEVVDALMAVPGAGIAATFKRYGKAGMMYIGNLFKTAANEAIQEPTENFMTTWVNDAIKGKNFFDRDWQQYGQELAQDAFYAAIGTLGNSLASMPAWSRSAVYADKMMAKTGLTAEEVRGAVDAFMADMNDPQVAAQLQANLTAASEQYVTGEMLRQGALGEVNAQPVIAAQEKLNDATQKLDETVRSMQITSANLETANERFAANPADPKATADMLAAIDADNKAAQDNQSARAVQAKAQADLYEANAQLKATTDAAMEAVRSKAAETVEQRTQEIRRFNYSDVDTDSNIQIVSGMEPAATLTGSEFTFGDKNLTKDVAAYFENEYGGMVRNPVLGDVLLNRRGAKDSLGHGMTPQKAIAYAAVPEVIQNGQIIDIQKNWKQKQLDTFAIAAPIKIESGEKPGDYYMAVVVQRTSAADGQRFYVHDVILQENKKTGPEASFEPEGITESLPTAEEVTSGDAKDPTLDSLLQKVRDVKRSPAEADSSVPNSDEEAPQPSGSTGISQFAAQTGQNTTVLSDSVKNELRESPYYQKTTQKGNVNKAISAVETEGYETRRNKLLDGTTNLYSPEGQAEAFVLARIAKENGDVSGESAIAFKVKESGTLLGQSLAMRQLYVQMTPEGKQQFIQRIVDQINQDYANRKKDTRVEAPEWLSDRLKQAGDDKVAVEKVYDDVYAFLADQMPPDWKTRFNAFRYTAMLANPRTHIRNLLGNALFTPAVMVKNQIGAVGELAIPKDQRTKSLGLVKKEYRDFAKTQLDSVRDALTGDGKHTPQSEIQQKRRNFNNGVLEWLSKGNGKLLDKEDSWFLNAHFSNSLAGFLQARGADLANVDSATLHEGLEYAISEAKKATYRDSSVVADKLSKFTRDLSNSKSRGARAAGLLVEGTLPFKKTPINVMRRGIEYSPVGLANALSFGLHDLKTGEITANEFVDRIASGVTGTGLALIGAMLYNWRHLKLSLDDTEDELDKLQGAQEYSVELGGYSYTIDWLSPSAMPLFVGGAIAELLSEGMDEVNLDTLGEALMNIAEPVFNLSMLDGVNSLLSAASYSENGVADVAMRAAESYATQFVPTVFGAFARTFDKVRRTTYTDKNSGIPASIQYLTDSTINKIPRLSRTGQPYLNAWGEEDVTEQWWIRALENFVSPGYINKLDPDDVEQHLMELFDATGESGLIPKTPQKYFTAGGERVDLTGEQYEQLTKERGQTAKRLHEELFGNEEFLSMPAEYQVDALESVWDYSTTIAKSHIADGVSVSAWMEADDPVAEIMKKAKDKMVKDQNDAFKNDLYSAIDSGDAETASTYVAGLIRNGVTVKSLKTSTTTKYKNRYRELYADGDVGGMRDLENALMLLNIGYRSNEFSSWLD